MPASSRITSMEPAMTRRFFLGLFGSLLTIGLLGVPGCGDGGDGAARNGAAAGGTAVEARGQTLRIGVSIPAATHGWPAGVGWWAEQTIAQYPDIRWSFQRASRAADQAAHIEAMLQSGIDALVVLPMDSDTPLTAVADAKRRGVYVVSVDRGLRRPIADIYIAGDNRAFGRKSAEFMVERLGGEGRIVILRGMPVEIDTERYESAMEVFRANPGINVLGAQPGNWNQQEAYRVMQGFLAQHANIDAVWASDDDMALGVERAIRDAGRMGEMWVLGGAGMKDIVRRVRDNDPLFPANITYPPGMIAAGIHAAVAALRPDQRSQIIASVPAHLGIDAADLEQKVNTSLESDEQQDVTFDVHLVTPENAEQYYFPDSVY
jgi:ribose transport system substrate-binding protein